MGDVALNGQRRGELRVGYCAAVSKRLQHADSREHAATGSGSYPAQRAIEMRIVRRSIVTAFLPYDGTACQRHRLAVRRSMFRRCAMAVSGDVLLRMNQSVILPQHKRGLHRSDEREQGNRTHEFAKTAHGVSRGDNSMRTNAAAGRCVTLPQPPARQTCDLMNVKRPNRTLPHPKR